MAKQLGNCEKNIKIKMRRIVMAFVIEDSCTNCGDCEKICPADAISQVGDQRVINTQHCIDCGSCVDVCKEKSIIEI